MTWKKIIKEQREITPDDEKLEDLKEELKDLIEAIVELHEKRDDVKYFLDVKTLDEMYREEDIKQAFKGLNLIFDALDLY